VLEHLGVDSIERHAIQLLPGGDRMLWVLRISEWFRNVLILVPVLVTWLGLFEAATNYAAAVQAQPDLQYVSFLLLWQQNFMNLGVTPGMPFSTIAAIDFSVLLVIIVLTIFIHFVRDVLETRATSRAANLRRRIDGLAWRTSLWLADKGIQQHQQEQRQWDQRLQTFDRFTPTAQDLLASLIAEQDRVVNLATAYQQEFDQLRILSRDLAAATSSLPASVQQVQLANSQAWTQLQGSLTSSLNTLQQVSAQQAQLQAATTSMGDDIRQASQAMVSAASQSGKAADAAAQASAQASGLAQQLHASQAGLQDKMRDTSAALQGSAVVFAGIIASLNQLRSGLDDLLQSNGQVINGLSTLVQQQPPIFEKFEQIAAAFQSDSQRVHSDFAQLVQLDGAMIEEIRKSVLATQGLSLRIDGMMQTFFRAPAPTAAPPARPAQQPTEVAVQPISPASQEKRGGLFGNISRDRK
jgi:uncharacterized phage infection (PIP) family protein YhgE